uniref:Ig-like domain-containing protein n=2 Tax=Dicentrarchus labrax TaxID=13489 RepID=A0A8P4GGX2_DICLA
MCVCVCVCVFTLSGCVPLKAAGTVALWSLSLLETLEPYRMDLFAFKTLLFLLSFIGCCAGTDILPTGPVDAILGRNVTLKTLLDKPEFSFLVWNFNGGTEAVNVVTVTKTALKVNPDYQGRVSVNRTNGYLTLASLKADDSGDYSLTLTTETADTTTGEIKLRVLEPVSGVVIKSSVPEAIEKKDTVVLTCSAKGSFLKFTWLNGTTPIVVDGNRLSVEGKELSSALTIRNVYRTDLVGPIYCRVANNLETENSAPFNLTVYYGPEAVTITPSKTPLVLKSGTNFSLTCSAVSSPPATFTWYHNNTIMEIGGPLLTLEKIKEHGLGDKEEPYMCKAENTKTKGTVASSAVSIRVMEGISGVTVTGPKAVLIADNSTANISCQAAAGVVEKRSWMKDGKPLAASARVVFSSDQSSVMINPVQKEDNGEYKCELSNHVSTAQNSYKMVVNYGPEAAMVKGEEKVEVNEEVTLTCSAVSVPPANFTWKFNGTATNVKGPTYVIPGAAYKNSGTYTCEANNVVTGKTTMHTHTLSVNAEGTLDGLSDGAIAGIVIAVLVALGAAIGLIIYCRQKVPVESPY